MSEISERAVTNDFRGEPAEIADPLAKIKHILERWQQLIVPWWKLRDPASMDRVTLPVTNSRDEWARAFTNLAHLVVEGFDIRAVRAKLNEVGTDWQPEERSVQLLERVLSGDAEYGSGQNLDAIRLVQRIRSKVDAHSRGAEATALASSALREHGSYGSHFANVCEHVATELERIERAFSQDNDGTREE